MDFADEVQLCKWAPEVMLAPHLRDLLTPRSWKHKSQDAQKPSWSDVPSGTKDQEDQIVIKEAS